MKIEKVLVEKEKLKLVKTDKGLEIVNDKNVVRRNYCLTVSAIDKRNEKFMEFLINQNSIGDSLKALVYNWIKINGTEDISDLLKIE